MLILNNTYGNIGSETIFNHISNIFQQLPFVWIVEKNSFRGKVSSESIMLSFFRIFCYGSLHFFGTCCIFYQDIAPVSELRRRTVLVLRSRDLGLAASLCRPLRTYLKENAKYFISDLLMLKFSTNRKFVKP